MSKREPLKILSANTNAWYRRDPVGAASFLMHHDVVKDIPEALPEPNEDE
jgi:hypothetical protein